MPASEIKHTCHECGRKYQTVKTLKTHMKTYHNNKAVISDDDEQFLDGSEGSFHSGEDSKTSQPSNNEDNSTDLSDTKLAKMLKRNKDYKTKRIDLTKSKKPRSSTNPNYSELYRK